jgi:hypothetical protein
MGQPVKYFYVKEVLDGTCGLRYCTFLHLKRYKFTVEKEGYVHGIDLESGEKVALSDNDEIFYDNELQDLLDDILEEIHNTGYKDLATSLLDFFNLFNKYDNNVACELEYECKDLFKRLVYLNNIYEYIKELEKEADDEC